MSLTHDHGDDVFDIAEGLNASQLPARPLGELRPDRGLGVRPTRDALDLEEERQLARGRRPHVSVLRPANEQRLEVMLGSPAKSDELVTRLPVAGRVPTLQEDCILVAPMPLSGRGRIRRVPSAQPQSETLVGFNGSQLQALRVASPRGSSLGPRSDGAPLVETQYLRPAVSSVSSKRLFGPDDSGQVPPAPLVAAASLSYLGSCPSPTPHSLSLHLPQAARIPSGAWAPHAAGQVYFPSVEAGTEGPVPGRSSWSRRPAAGGMAALTRTASHGVGSNSHARESRREWSRGLAWLYNGSSDGSLAFLDRGYTGQRAIPSHHMAVRNAGDIRIQASFGDTPALPPPSICGMPRASAQVSCA